LRLFFNQLFHFQKLRIFCSVCVTKNKYGLPQGDYGLIEMYCNDEGCDCRRVFLNVMMSLTKKSGAYVAYGWESMSYYAEWFLFERVDVSKLRGDDLESVIRLKGPCLNMCSPKSQYAPAILKMVSKYLHDDIAYVDRLKRHYKKKREKVDESYRKGIQLE
jgi:hypothetical protein